MSDQTRQQLQRAFQLIKSGQKQQAVDILTPILHADRDNADAWWLMAHALDNPNYQRQALQNVLRLRPNDEKARAMLDKLHAAAPPPARKPAPPEDDPFAALDAADDPFAVVKDTDETFDPFADVQDSSEPFVDDPFADLVEEKPSKRTRAQTERRVPTQKKETSTTQIVLIVCGSILLFGCVVCAGLSIAGVNVMGEIMKYVTPNPDGSITFGTEAPFVGGQTSGGGDLNGIIGDLNMQGSVAFFEPRYGTVADAFDNHGYTFEGGEEEFITIELNSMDGQLDPELALYGPNGLLVAQNDDIDFVENNNSRIDVTLPSTGTYTVVVSGFASGGAYELILSR